MNLSDRYPVYSANSSRCLRWMLILLVLVCFYVSALTGFVWLYGVSAVLLVIAGSFFSLLCSTVSFSEEGIRLRYGFFRVYAMKWEDVLCCGSFTVTVLGASGKEEYLYFSKSSVSPSRLAAGRTLPTPSGDFLFLGKQEKAIESVNHFWKNAKARYLD